MILDLCASDVRAELALQEIAFAWPEDMTVSFGDPVEVELRAEPCFEPAEAVGQFGIGDWSLSFLGFWHARGSDLRTIHVKLGRGRAFAFTHSLKAFLRFLCAEILARKGGIALHAAAVAFPDGVCVFLARSGGGKTTLIRRFAAERNLGDDFCPICPVGDRLWVLPSPFSGREDTPVTGAPGPLRCVAELVQGVSAAWEPISPHEGVGAVLKAALVHTSDLAVRRGLLETALRMVRESTTGRLTFSLSEAPWGVVP